MSVAAHVHVQYNPLEDGNERDDDNPPGESPKKFLRHAHTKMCLLLGLLTGNALKRRVSFTISIKIIFIFINNAFKNIC